MKQPNFFIVGFPKSGTTALYDFLKQHNQIYMPDLKEPHFFCTDFHDEVDQYYQEKSRFLGIQKRFRFRKLKEYLELFSDAREEKMIGEASVHYLYSRKAAQKIYEYNPDSKIIISIRNPIHFVRSWYQWNKFDLLAEGAENIEEALNYEEKRKKGMAVKVKRPPLSHLFYLEQAKYDKHIKKFLNLFPRKNIKIVLFDDFYDNNLKVCKEIYSFLEVDPNFTPRIKQVNSSSIPLSISLRHLLDLKYVKKFREFMRTWLSKRLYKRVKTVYDSVVYKDKNKVQMSEAVRKEIIAELKSHVKNVDHLLHRENLIDSRTNLIRLWNFE